MPARQRTVDDIFRSRPSSAPPYTFSLFDGEKEANRKFSIPLFPPAG